MTHIYGLTLEELEGVLVKWQEKKFHARQVFAWLYKKKADDFGAMSDLSEDLRKKLKENFYLYSMKLSCRQKSRDGTEKLLFALKDASCVEAVIIPQDDRVTGCVSTQVGCKFACSFCASGMRSFRRNLSSAEIVEEVLALRKYAPENKLTHIVFMGTGEPLDNYENVLKAVRIINSPEALRIASRRITISSAGIIPGIKRLAEEGLQIELSISLHSADDKIRSHIMPINKKYPLKELMAACKDYIAKTGRQVTFEYILIKGINSSLQDAVALCKILKGLRLCKVNLIPANTVRELSIQAPNKLEILFFKDALLKQGINVTLRKERGEDIQAACGQLRLRYEKAHSS